MLVYTEEWVQALRTRYDSRSRIYRSTPYFIATADEFQLVREQIEAWVADLPAHSQARVIPRLRSKKLVWETYHELAIGSLLRNLGLRLEYDKNFGLQTPDWFVASNDGSQTFIVEVFTQNISESKDAKNTKQSDLMWKLRQIPLNVVLGITFAGLAAKFDSRRNKQIAAEVKKWLEENDSKVGSKFRLDEFTFEILRRNGGRSPNVRFICSQEFGFVGNPIPMRKNFDEKIYKYKALVTSEKIPLVIAVVANFQTCYDAEDLENILFGKEVSDIAFDRSTNEVVSETVRRKNDGLFAEKPLLSGAIWAWKTNAEKWNMKSYFNPQSQHSLPPNIFWKQLSGEKLFDSKFNVSGSMKLFRILNFKFQASLALVIFFTACNTRPLPPANLDEGGWKVQQGQAVWRAKKTAPEIAGELLLATNFEGRTFLQFTKTPFPFIIAQISSNSWQLEVPAQNKKFSGPGKPPARIGWFHLPPALNGIAPPQPWIFRRRENENWRLENKSSGEMIEGYLAP